MTDLFDADNNATPLTEAERADLIPTHISLRSELNELEQKNVAEAYVWAFRRKRQVIDEAFLKGLHRRMFNVDRPARRRTIYVGRREYSV